MIDIDALSSPHAPLAFACGACSGLVPRHGLPNAVQSRVSRRLPRPIFRPRRAPLAARVPSMSAKSTSSAVDAKAELLRVVPNRSVAELEKSGELKRVRDLLLELEAATDARPETATFTEFALSGTWEFAFSTSPTRPWDDIRIEELVQIVDPAAKTITNSCRWTLLGGEEHEQVKAKLDIVSGYSFPDESAIMLVGAPSHQLRLVEDEPSAAGKAPSFPDDIQSVIERLQAAVPMEFWDSSGQVDPATYMDFEFRIACVIGERLQGLRSVYTRRPADE